MIATAGLSEAKQRLLQRLLRGEERPDSRACDRVTPRPAGAAAPISPEQRQVWLHAAMAPHLPLYNEAITIHRKGPFDLAVLEASLHEILRRHEIWRTSFQEVDGDVMQIVHPDLHVSLPLADLTAFPETEREREALRIATETARQPIGLTQAPLFRANVVKLAEDEHRLYLTLHHIIFDGVTIYRVIVPELAAIYAALARGERPALPPPPLQFGDYALWRERMLARDGLAPQIEYWRQQLAGELPVLQLPSDRQRSPTVTFHGSMETFGLPTALTEKLKRWSRQQGATLYMTLLAAFKTLLFRYTGQADIVVGGVVDMRRRPEIEPLAGYLLNPVLLRTRAAADMPFREYLRQTRNVVLGALDASDVPFDRVLQVMPRRNPGSRAAVPVMFSIEPPVTPFADGWDLTQMDVTVGATKFDLYLELDERPEGLIGRFIYSTDLFDAATIRRMIEHWTSLLEAITADPDCPLGSLALLTPRESRQLLVEWNDTSREAPETTVHDWFTAWVGRSPDAVAVEFEGNRWTYGDLNQAANQVAAQLRAAGVERKAVVAIHVERSLEMLAGILGIWKAGAAYLPLDPAHPPARLGFMLADARPEVILTQRHLLEKLPRSGCRTVLFEEVGREVPPATEASAGAGPDDLAYVLYTSGSTGQPKAVDVPHRGVVNHLAAMQRVPGCKAGDTMLAVTTLSFDPSVLDLFLPLVSGARVVIASQAAAKDPRRLADLIRQSACTMMQGTPTLWRALVESGWRGAPGLRILCGGEPLTRSLADALIARSASLWNLYGPTETTIWATLQKVEAGGGPPPIGRPIMNARLYVLDALGHPVPVGIAGELHIGGVCVARGYRNRPDLTRERFVTREVAPGERLYRTGDVVRYRSDGALEFIGRNDDQVKVRGFRIELKEVEAAIEAHPLVAAAALRAWPDAAGETCLAAYVVARLGTAPQASDLREFLRERLPAYMTPASLTLLPALPMTAAGKIDRNSLPEPEIRVVEPEFVEPSNATEAKLATVWKHVLGVPAVGLHDDFFDLGGHSLRAATLLRRIEAEFGMRLPMSAVFHAPTVAQMAALLSDESRRACLPRTIEYNASGSRPRLIWVHGGPLGRVLAQTMGSDQPVLNVTLDRDDLDQLGPAPPLAEIAARIVRIVRAEQPSGPYYLGGYCVSGTLAYESASQLVAQGEEVRLLLLVHSPDPLRLLPVGTARRHARRLRRHLRILWALRGAARLRYAVHLGRRALRRLATPEQSPAPPQHQEFRHVIERALPTYKARAYPGAAVLFQPIERKKTADCRPGWSKFVKGEFLAFDTLGDHFTLIRPPHVHELGTKMRECLRRAHAAAASRDGRNAAAR